jgi:hypothetical protein
MQLIISKRVAGVILAALLSAAPVVAQSVRVELGKDTRRIPKGCESVVPASIDGQIDIPALVKEALCKGAGDMLIEYSYTMKSDRRVKNKKGDVKESTSTYEVFIPTLKSGARARGILVATSHDGIPVPPDKLEKERTKAGERLEKEEARIEREAPSVPLPAEDTTKGVLPIGMYSRMAVHHSAIGVDRTAALTILTFLQTCELTLLRRVLNEGREIMVFTFVPRPDAQFKDEEKYIAQLNGEIWIDAQARIVTRLVGWPTNAQDKNVNLPSAEERPPAVYVEMIRLKEGIWLPRMARINAADYPKLFDGFTQDSTSTYSNYIRFSTEIKDVKVSSPGNP